MATMYAIMKRKKGTRRSYSDGYRTPDLKLITAIARELSDSGEYTMVNVINADTGKRVESFTPATK